MTTAMHAYQWLPWKEALYFLGLVAAMAAAFALATRACLRAPNRGVKALHLAFAGGALYVTWSHIFEFMAADVAAFDSFEQWLHTSNVFERAYLLVTRDVYDWWWSGQLLLWITPGILYMQVMQFRCNGPSPALFVFVAFLGAVSVGAALFFITTVLGLSRGSTATGKGSHAVYIPWTMTVSYALAILSAVLTPFARHFNVFKANLLFLHAIFFVPLLLFSVTAARRKGSVAASHVFLVIGGVSLACHLINTLQVAVDVARGSGSSQGLVSSTVAALAAHGFDHACQGGISWDVVLTSLLTMALILQERRGAASYALAALTPVLGASASLSLHVALLEAARADSKDSARNKAE